MQFHDLADDREPETQAALTRRRSPVSLAKPFEHVGQELGADPLPRVDNVHFDARTGRFDRHTDSSAFGREFDRVRQQVPDHLLQPGAITAHQRP